MLKLLSPSVIIFLHYWFCESIHQIKRVRGIASTQAVVSRDSQEEKEVIKKYQWCLNHMS